MPGNNFSAEAHTHKLPLDEVDASQLARYTEVKLLYNRRIYVVDYVGFLDELVGGVQGHGVYK